MENSCSRRRLLRASLAGGAIISTKALPEKWITPVVDSVLLPVHALSSGPTNQLNQISCAIETAPPQSSTTTNDPDSGTDCADFSTADILARTAGDVTTVGGVLIRTTISSSAGQTITEITKIVVNQMSFCFENALTLSQVNTALTQLGFDPTALTVAAPTTNQINQGTDTVNNITRNITLAPGVIFVGDLVNDCANVIIVTGSILVEFTVSTTVTQKILNVTTYTAS